MNGTLQHIGIPGMKWGHRKSEGSSGSRTSGRFRSNSADHQTIVKIKKKRLSEMSNEDIKALANRTQLEKQYRDLKPNKMAAGKKIVGGILLNVGTQVVTQSLIAALTPRATKYLNETFAKVFKETAKAVT